jgi:hypothetical protein
MSLITELEWYRLTMKLQRSQTRALALALAILLVRKAVGG